MHADNGARTHGLVAEEPTAGGVTPDPVTCDVIDIMADLADLDDFRQQCIRQLARPVAARIRFGFFRNANPVRDWNRNLAFDSMSDYRAFCESNYPAYFGYARPRRAARGT